jgi:hypothetical protein
MVTGGDAAAAPAMATEAEGSVRATPDAPDADVVMAAHGSRHGSSSSSSSGPGVGTPFPREVE